MAELAGLHFGGAFIGVLSNVFGGNSTHNPYIYCVADI